MTDSDSDKDPDAVPSTSDTRDLRAPVRAWHASGEHDVDSEHSPGDAVDEDAVTNRKGQLPDANVPLLAGHRDLTLKTRDAEEVYGRPAAVVKGVIIAGRYRIEELIGAGGMGQVYRAKQLGLERDVAVKIIASGSIRSQAARGHFDREARVASTLRHPNAVQVYDYGDYNGGVFLAMELIHGDTLRQALMREGGALPVRRALRIGAGIADVLVAAHELALVHRDLKPDNIMLEISPSGEERSRVMDFGLAFIEGDEQGLGRVTQGSVISGTPEYMAPEQVLGKDVGVAADLYSLGCVLYEMLVGRPPFQDPFMASLFAKHMFMEPLPLREIAPQLEAPAILEDLVQALLAKDPATRPSAVDVWSLLTNLDPAAPERMGHGNTGTSALGRTSRMVSMSSPAQTETSGEPTTNVQKGVRLTVGIVGSLDEATVLGLASHALQLVTVGSPKEVADLELLLLCDPEPSEVARWLGHGASVVVVLGKTNFDDLAGYLRSGVDEVVVPPIQPERLVRQLLRALRKRARPRQSS